MLELRLNELELLNGSSSAKLELRVQLIFELSAAQKYKRLFSLLADWFIRRSSSPLASLAPVSFLPFIFMVRVAAALIYYLKGGD